MKLNETFSHSVSQHLQKYEGIDVIFSGWPNYLDPTSPPSPIIAIVLELTGNSPIRRWISDQLHQKINAPDFTISELLRAADEIRQATQERPHRIGVTLGNNFMVISDDYPQPDTYASLLVIQKALDADHAGTTTKKRPGGAGITEVKRALEKIQGTITYRSTSDSRISTIITWNSSLLSALSEQEKESAF